MNYQQCYEMGVSRLGVADIAEAKLDARLLLEYICGTNRNDLLVHGDREVSKEQMEWYEAAIAKRESRIPLQHITGEQEFMGLTFQVNEHVLIPRQDTEVLVEEVMRDMMDGMHILDMCTGSGCILISLLHYSNDCVGTGVDLSPNALLVAKENAEKILGEKCSYSFIESNLFENVEGVFDVIVSNPPYIQTKVIDTLMPEVRLHEPMMALDGSEDGLLFYRRIVEESKMHLRKEGRLCFEIGYDQGEAVKKLMEDGGFKEVKVIKDLAGLDRVVLGIYM